MRKSRENGLFKDVPDHLWNDWHWQVENRIETLDQLKQHITLTPEEEEGVATTLGKLRMSVTPYYLSLIDLDDPFDPIRKMAIPTDAELFHADYEDADPLHEDTDSPCPGLTHRLPELCERPYLLWRCLRQRLLPGGFQKSRRGREDQSSLRGTLWKDLLQVAVLHGGLWWK